MAEDVEGEALSMLVLNKHRAGLKVILIISSGPDIYCPEVLISATGQSVPLHGSKLFSIFFFLFESKSTLICSTSSLLHTIELCLMVIMVKLIHVNSSTNCHWSIIGMCCQSSWIW